MTISNFVGCSTGKSAGADSAEITEEALSLIDVQYQELPFVTDPVEAIRPGGPVLHDNPGWL